MLVNATCYVVRKKISLFALTVVVIFVTKQRVCDKRHQLTCRYLFALQNSLVPFVAIAPTGGPLLATNR